QPAPCEAIDQSRPAFVGSVSDKVTPCASPLPEFETVNMKPICSPAFTWAASAVFTIWIAGAATQISAESSSEPSLVVVTLPVLSTSPVSWQSPPVAAVVPETMCTVKVLAAWVVPAGTVTGPQDRTPAVIAQLLFQPAPCEAIDQSRPAFVGSVSDKVTPCASPLPEFETVNVKPICSPAFTWAASAVFTMWMSAALITSCSLVHSEETGPVLLLSPE